MSVEQVPLGFADIAVPPGSHIAFSYASETDRVDRLFGFVKAGLDNSEKCVVAVCEYTRPFLAERLRLQGVDVDTVLDRQLIILAPSDLFPALQADPRGAVHRLAETVRGASQEGWCRTRICSSVTPCLQKTDSVPKILQAEAEIDRAVGALAATWLCTFRRGCAHKKVLDRFLETHPLVTDGKQLSPNPNHQESDVFLRALPTVIEELRTVGALNPPFACLDFEGNTPVIRTHGEMDFFTVPQVEELGRSLYLVGHSRFVVDLSDTSFLDAAAIRSLLNIRKLAEGKGGRLAIYDPTSPQRRIFQLVHLDRYIPIRATLAEATNQVTEAD